MARDENMIAALKRERAGYVAVGDEDRVRQVDEQLAHYGYKPDGDSEQDGPKGRTGTPQQTADQGKTPSKRAAKKAAAAPPPKTAEPSTENGLAATPPAE
jgi:hypothetical protein